MLKRVQYLDTALPTGSATFALFDTTVASANVTQKERALPNLFSRNGFETFELSVKCSQAGTLKSYASQDRGTTWVQVSETAIAASASTGSDFINFMVGMYADWKLSWVNGGVTQTSFVLDMALSTNVAL